MDNCLSADEIQLMTEVLYTKEKGRAVDNRTCLRENRSGYVVFAYQMGIACYYFSGEEGGKGRAEGWLKIVADADPAVLDLGEYEDMKEAWQARAVILERLSVYDTYKIDRMNYMGEAVSYREYWKDLMALMAEKLADKDNIVTELGLYQEIVMAIFDRTADFKEEAGLLRSELEGVLDEIEFRLEQIDPGNRQRIQELKENIEQTMGKARRNISAVYAEKQENN